MVHALNDDNDMLSSTVGDLKIVILSSVTKSQNVRRRQLLQSQLRVERKDFMALMQQSAKPVVELMARA